VSRGGGVRRPQPLTITIIPSAPNATRRARVLDRLLKAGEP
jgi:hypothetical protein